MTNNRIPTQMTEQISGLFRTFQHYKIPENHDLPYYHLWHSRSFLIATHDAVLPEIFLQIFYHQRRYFSYFYHCIK